MNEKCCESNSCNNNHNIQRINENICEKKKNENENVNVNVNVKKDDEKMNRVKKKSSCECEMKSCCSFKEEIPNSFNVNVNVMKKEQKSCCKSQNENDEGGSSCCNDEKKKIGSGSGCCDEKCGCDENENDTKKIKVEKKEEKLCCSDKCCQGKVEKQEEEKKLEKIVPCKDECCSSSSSCEKKELEELKEIKIDDCEKNVKVVNLSINGMECSGCVTKVDTFLSKLKGVLETQLNMITQKGIIKYDTKIINDEKRDIIDKLIKLGYNTEKIEIELKGESIFQIKEFLMLKKVENYLISMENMILGFVKINDNTFKVIFNDDLINPRKIIELVKEKLGIDINKRQDVKGNLEDTIMRKKEIKHYRNMFLSSLLFTIPAMICALILGNIKPVDYYFSWAIYRSITPKNILLFILSTPVQFIYGMNFYILGFKALKEGCSPDKNVLISLSCWVAYIVSIVSIIFGLVDEDYKGKNYMESSAVLISFLLLGQWLENYASKQTSKSLVKLLRLQPDDAILIENVETKEELVKKVDNKEALKEKVIPLSLVWKKDIIKVIPGEKIPTDSTVIFGSSMVNQSMLTGESVPVEKTINDEVIGGTLNVSGTIYIQVNKTASENVLSKIIELIEKAQLQKPKIQDVIDKVSKVFVPAIIIISIAVFVLWMLLSYLALPDTWLNGMNEVLFSLLNATSTLVIACPCALGLCVSLVVMISNGVAAKYGILYKGGGQTIALLKKSNIICFDKTGTLTEGSLSISEIMIVDEEWSKKRNEFLRIIASCENCLKKHPIAHTILEYVKQQTKIIDFQQPDSFENINGRGLSCEIFGVSVVIGNKSFMKDRSIDISSVESMINIIHKTIVYVSFGSKIVGVITLTDQIKPNVDIVINKLKEMGKTIIMLTGDNDSVAKKIGNEIGILSENIHSEMTPFGKSEFIKEMQKKSKKNIVCFVGDGINDSVGLTQSHVGISFSSGTEIAMECSQVVLMKKDLQSLLVAFDIAKKAHLRVLWNVFWAFAYNIISIPIAAGALFPLIKQIIPPWICAISMTLSCLSITFNTILFRVFYRQKIIKKE